MTTNDLFSTYNYLDQDTDLFTLITIYKYQRPRPQSRLTQVPISYIGLPLPVKIPTDTYGIQTSEIGLGIAGNSLDALNSLPKIDAFSDITRSIKALTERLLDDPVNNAKSIINTTSRIGAVLPQISDAVRGPIQTSLGVVRNPHTAVLFENVNLKQYQLSWRLSPRNKKQAQTLEDIINKLKISMHPTLGLAGFALDYPNLFKVDFNINTSKASSIPSINYSFLTDFRIDPSPEGHVYRSDNKPGIVDIHASFLETRIKTAEDFQSPN